MPTPIIKAKDSVTVIDYTDVQNVKTWYIAVLRTSSAPTVAQNATEAQMIANGWGVTEPGVDTTKKLYTVQQCIFGDGTYVWGDVSLSSSYEAAIESYNYADSVQTQVNVTNDNLDSLNQSTFGTIVYYYTHSGVTETVYKRDDGTYYYINSSDEEVTVSESNLDRDPDSGMIITDRISDGLKSSVDALSDDLNGVSNTATDALSIASEANDAAQEAAESADTAGNQLSELQKIIDIIQWANEHGQYSDDVTEDTEVQPGKLYFERSGVSPNYSYYYISNPTGNPHNQGWYELSASTQSINSYVSTHLDYADDGNLYVRLGDNSTTRMQLASDGIYLYVGNDLVAKYTEVVQLGHIGGVHVTLSPNDGLVFLDGTTPVAWVSANTLSIEQAEVKRTLTIGKFKWQINENNPNRISLIYAAE